MEEDILKKVVIACTSHKGLTPYTMRSIQACPHVGVSLSVGIAEVALARNLQVRDSLAMALKGDREVILLLDDDIVFQPRDVRTVALEAVASQEPVSGVYAVGDFERGDVKIAAMPINKPDRWVVGLGFLAVPVAALVRQLEEFPVATWKDETFRVVTWSGPAAPAEAGSNKLMWLSEDYRLCMRLGGVRLNKHVRVGHAKMCPFYPDPEPEELGQKTKEFLAEKLGTSVDNLKINYTEGGT